LLFWQQLNNFCRDIRFSVVHHIRTYLARKHPLSDDLDYRGETFISGATVPEESSIHSARHTIAVQLLKKTGNLRQIQKQLGHASPATTANMYADITFEDMQNGLNGLYQ